MKVDCGMLIERKRNMMEMCCILSVMVIPGEKSNFILEFLMGPKRNGFRSRLLRDSARSQIGLFADD